MQGLAAEVEQAERPTSAATYVHHLQDELQQFRTAACANLVIAQGKQKEWYNRGGRERHFQEWKAVLIFCKVLPDPNGDP